MSTVFTLSKSWHDSVWLFEQLAFASEGDAIVLLQDAVLAAHSDISLASFLAKCDALNISVFALEQDCQTRGINNKYEQLSLLSYSGFVDLVCQHEKQIAW